MSRVYPDYTYGNGPRERCFWAETVQVPEFSQARDKITCDVAIIGAGFTGLSAALHLAQAGEDVCVFEAETPGWGASGRNGGFCCLGGSAASDGMLRKLYGEEARREYRRSEAEAAAFAKALIKEHGIAADLHSDGETLLAHTPKAAADFTARAKQIEADYGVTPSLISGSDLAQNGMQGPFHGALTTPIGVALNPLKYALGLASAATRAGARIFANSPVTKIEQVNGFHLSTPKAEVAAKCLIVATNGYSSDDLPGWMRARYLPTQSNVIVTRPLNDEEISTQGWSNHQMCYDDRFFLHYFRLMPDKRMLFGMRGGLFSSANFDKRMHRTIRRHFEAMFPAWRHVESAHSWNGLLSLAPDLTPYAGPIPDMPGAFTAMSFHGNGVAMGSYAGALLADLVQGKAPEHLYPKIMQAAPRRWPLGRLRRAMLWPPYALATLMRG
ncbi:Gamma-glutamylputrescine oxidoreductase [Roseovarius gaetbuli]|uniref:Gamma-glutamylputrescine oxidoreductase n=1 Tax=Roseovarius gaetbuli TaxID=1356575 RepID=A0A1X7A5P8_9RHOB|nr:FAD-dependent oxidoreductase [Roseovarius gaetbuli]SLN71287.1 Gamma-glutamylputrescine oxidoreductase [Roseovarius gaetbuli]